MLAPKGDVSQREISKGKGGIHNNACQAATNLQQFETTSGTLNQPEPGCLKHGWH